MYSLPQVRASLADNEQAAATLVRAQQEWLLAPTALRRLRYRPQFREDQFQGQATQMKLLQSRCEPSPCRPDKPPHGDGLRAIGNAPSVLRAGHPCLTRLVQAALWVLFASFSSLSAGEPLGRLFFTPDERGNLDRARQAGGISEEEAAPAKQAESITLNGIVKRSSGQITVWVNQEAQHEADLPPASKRLASKARPAEFPVLVQKTGNAVTLKVGQTLNIESGEIREIYQPSVIKEPSAAAGAGAIQAGNKG